MPKGRHLSSFVDNGNPFDTEAANCTNSEDEIDVEPRSTGFFTDATCSEVLRLMQAFVDSKGKESIVLTTRCIAEWLLPWTSRLLVITEKLPTMYDDACSVITSLFDLYSTTVFRLCAGNSANERILLGLEQSKTKAVSTHEQMVRVHRASSPHFGFGGLRAQASHQKPSRPAPTISRQIEAELCALVPMEYDCLSLLRELIFEAQKNLQSVAKLDLVDGWIADPILNEETVEDDFARETARVLEKRQAGCWSYVSLAVALYAATETLGREGKSLKGYSDRLLRCLPLLVCLSSRISCMRAIRGRTLVKEVRTHTNELGTSCLTETNTYIR